MAIDSYADLVRAQTGDDTITLTSTDDGEAYDFVIVYEGDGHEDHDCDVCSEPILMGYVSESGLQAYCCICIVDKFLAPD